MNKLLTCQDCPHHYICKLAEALLGYNALSYQLECSARKKERELTEILAKALNSLEEHNREYHYNTSTETIAELRERFGITDIVRRLPGEYGLDKN